MREVLELEYSHVPIVAIRPSPHFQVPVGGKSSMDVGYRYWLLCANIAYHIKKMLGIIGRKDYLSTETVRADIIIGILEK